MKNIHKLNEFITWFAVILIMIAQSAHNQRYDNVPSVIDTGINSSSAVGVIETNNMACSSEIVFILRFLRNYNTAVLYSSFRYA